MTITPNDLAPRGVDERKLDAVRARHSELAPVDTAIAEVHHCMNNFLDAGYRFDEAAHLTAIALDNVMEEQ